MGMYIYITDNDRKIMRTVEDKSIQEVFNEALSFDKSLLISERRWVEKGFFKKAKLMQDFSIYHDVNPDESPYQARFQFAGSGNKTGAMAYLYGIINGTLSQLRVSDLQTTL